MSEHKEFRFRSLNGKIYSTDQDAFAPRLTISRARSLLNALYEIAVKHDPEVTRKVVKEHNA